MKQFTEVKGEASLTRVHILMVCTYCIGKAE